MTVWGCLSYARIFVLRSKATLSTAKQHLRAAIFSEDFTVLPGHVFVAQTCMLCGTGPLIYRFRPLSKFNDILDCNCFSQPLALYTFFQKAGHFFFSVHSITW